MIGTPRPKEDELAGRPFRPTRIGVVGGDLVAHLAALSLKEWRPELDVTLIGRAESGGAIASPPALVPFVLGFLGIDPLRFERAVRPTMMLGARREWGPATQDAYFSAYGDGDLVDAQAHDGDVRRYAMSAQLMAAGKAPFARVGGRVIPLLKETRFGWHLDEGRVTAFLRRRAKDVGVEVIDEALGAIDLADNGLRGVKRALTADGRVWGFDLWVDCGGRLIDALAVPFEPFALPCDRLISATRSAVSAAPYTTVTTLDAGWAWSIPLRDEERVGYVLGSRFTSDEAAVDELARRFPGIGEPRFAAFLPGRRREMIAGNVVAIGDAQGFVEPLVASGPELAISAIAHLIELLASGGQDARKVEAQVAARWEGLRWFLALHYRFNRQRDTAFWREVHMTTDWSGMEETVRDYLAHGALSQRSARLRLPSRGGYEAVAHAAFTARDVDLALMGQGVVPETLTPATTAAEWRELMSMREAVVAAALTPRESWPHLEDARLWNAFVHDEKSWCCEQALEMHRATPTRGRSQEALAFWTRELGVAAQLGRDAAKMPDEFPTSPNIDFGKFLKKVPEVVLRPKDQAQLAECLQMCARRRLPMRVRGAACSSGGQALADEGALIDLRWLKRVVAEAPDENRIPSLRESLGPLPQLPRLSPAHTGLIRVEAGIWWLELCGHLRSQGRRPLGLTDNWRSTVGGTLAVGGFGDASHRAGLQIAGVRELMVMTLDGTRHRVRAGDDLFDWSLAGRGQLGITTEVVLETCASIGTIGLWDLDARVLRWPTIESFVADAKTIVAERRFDWWRARIHWQPGAPVASEAGHFGNGTLRASDFTGLVATVGARDQLDLYAKSVEPPDDRRDLASPGVEVILPVDAAGIAAVHEITRRVIAAGLVPHLPEGSSLIALSGRDAARFPMAPLPPSELALMLAIRPELPLAEVPRFLPALRAIADLALDAGGKVHLMSLEPTRPGWLKMQLGAERYQRLIALKARWDPDGLLNPGLL